MDMDLRSGGFHAVTPYFVVNDGPRMIDFLVRAFDGYERFRAGGSEGGMHAEVVVGDSVVMVGQSDREGAGRNALTYLYVNDVDATYTRALEAGATSGGEPADQAYGDRTAHVIDPFGNVWYIATPIDDDDQPTSR